MLKKFDLVNIVSNDIALRVKMKKRSLYNQLVYNEKHDAKINYLNDNPYNQFNDATMQEKIDYIKENPNLSLNEKTALLIAGKFSILPFNILEFSKNLNVDIIETNTNNNKDNSFLLIFGDNDSVIYVNEQASEDEKNIAIAMSLTHYINNIGRNINKEVSNQKSLKKHLK